MTFLPLVERELRAASRRKGTYWIRFSLALVGLIFVFVCLAFASLGRPGSGLGQMTFTWMSYYAFLICLLTGAFAGADCIGEERREGTLGFLFLTDLKGYDVVLGKFFGVSLNAFYGLLAALPALGLSLLAGGVTAGEFWRMSLALLNTLFFSVTWSLFLSARLKTKAAPTMIALFSLVLIWVGGAALFSLSTHVAQPGWSRALLWISLVSPGRTFSLATAASYLYMGGDFWRSLVLSHFAGWLFLGAAAWGLDLRLSGEGRAFSFRFGRRRRKAALLSVNPIVWLLDDSPGLKIAAWILAGAGSVVALFALGGQSSAIPVIWAELPFYYLLKLLYAVAACRFFSESRANGALELMGATRLSDRDLISGQWAALRRVFLPPVLLILGTNLMVIAWLAVTQALESVGIIVMMGYQILTEAMDFTAIGWCGIWIALALKNPKKATWITILVAHRDSFRARLRAEYAVRPADFCHRAEPRFRVAESAATVLARQSPRRSDGDPRLGPSRANSARRFPRAASGASSRGSQKYNQSG